MKYECVRKCIYDGAVSISLSFYTEKERVNLCFILYLPVLEMAKLEFVDSGHSIDGNGGIKNGIEKKKMKILLEFSYVLLCKHWLWVLSLLLSLIKCKDKS